MGNFSGWDMASKFESVIINNGLCPSAGAIQTISLSLRILTRQNASKWAPCNLSGVLMALSSRGCAILSSLFKEQVQLYWHQCLCEIRVDYCYIHHAQNLAHCGTWVLDQDCTCDYWTHLEIRIDY